MKAGRLARDKVRNGDGSWECRFLSPCLRRWPVHDMGATPIYGNNRGCMRGNRLELEMALDEFAKLFAVFIAHVDEFDATAVRPDITYHGGEINLSETAADFTLNLTAATTFPRGFLISPTHAACL